MNTKNDFLHSLFVLKSPLGAEFGKDTKAKNATISMPEYVLMKKVFESLDGNVNLTEVREYLSITKAAVSQILSSLEKRGLLIRNTDPSNRRNLILTLTFAGKAVLEEKDMEVDTRIGEIIRALGEDEAKQLTYLITKMNGALSASSQI